MTSQRVYNVTNQRQLIDLNGDETNFDLTFSCTSEGGAPFDAVVLDQATLDKKGDIPYRKAAKGVISGNIVADKGKYQNYFLALQSEKPCKVSVRTQLKPVSTKRPSFPNKGMSTSRMVQPPTSTSSSLPMERWKMVSLVVVLCIGGALLCYFYLQENKTKEKPTTFFPTVWPVSPAPSVAPSVTSNYSDSLIDKLNNLDV